MMEYTSQALNEKVALYGERSLYQQLAEDMPVNDAVFVTGSVGPTLAMIDIRSGPTPGGEPAADRGTRQPPLAASLSVTRSPAAPGIRTSGGANSRVGVGPNSPATNNAVLARFERDLERVPFALYEVRRLYLPGRTKDCRTWHGKRCSSPRWWCRTKRTAKCRRGHQAGFDLRSGWVDTAPWCEGYDEACRGEQAKGQAWRSVRVTFEGTRLETETALLRWGREAEGVRVRSGRSSHIKRAHYLDAGDSYPSADAYLVAAPAGVESKQRGGFEEKWTQVTGLVGTRLPVCALPVSKRQRRLNGYVPVRHLHKEQCASAVELMA